MASDTRHEGSTDLPTQVIVDREACMGSGNCVYWAPAVFDLDDDGVAIVRGDATGHEDEVRQAVQNCPTKAIQFEAS
jgi:ferredoxin